MANDVSSSLERFWFDLFSAVLLFVTAIGGAYLPRYLTSHGGHVSASHSLAFHLGNMLSAGVMLSAGFCHLLADAHRHLLFLGRFPITNFLAATGYIITLLADQVVQHVNDQQAAAASPAGSGSGAAGHGGGGDRSGPSGVTSGGYNKLPSSAELAPLVGNGGASGLGKGGRAPSEGALTARRGGGEAPMAVAKAPLLGAGRNGSSSSSLLGTAGREGGGGYGPAMEDEDDADCGRRGELRPVLGASAGGAGGIVPRRSTGGSGPVGASGGGAGPSDECHSGVAMLLGSGRRLSFATAVLLAAALCIHSILEGMALGAQQSMRSTEDIMVAIAAHKGLAAYALGASIVESGASGSRFWTVISLFSLATPVGIFVGYGMSGVASGQGGAALSALASGTFLYVAFMEVIPKELADGNHRLLKMGAFLLGYGLMSLLAVWA